MLGVFTALARFVYNMMFLVLAKWCFGYLWYNTYWLLDCWLIEYIDILLLSDNLF
jgi:hypothetical protein